MHGGTTYTIGMYGCHYQNLIRMMNRMDDYISRQAVQEIVDRIGDIHPYRQIGNRESYSQYNEAWTDAINRVDAELNSLPSADIDLSDFSDKLWKTAYEHRWTKVIRNTVEEIRNEMR